jgi:hypothetical protein
MSRDASTMTSDSVNTAFNSPVDLAQSPARSEYNALSISDLLDAREQYHVHLMRHPNVVATAIGYYRIRHGDTPPGVASVVKGTGPRTLTNSEVRYYSWPAILVFVEEWVSVKNSQKAIGTARTRSCQIRFISLTVAEFPFALSKPHVIPLVPRHHPSRIYR